MKGRLEKQRGIIPLEKTQVIWRALHSFLWRLLCHNIVWLWVFSWWCWEEMWTKIEIRYLGINCSLHDLSISVPGDLSSRSGSRGSAGEIVRCVGLQTYNGATLHHGVWRRNCKAEQTYSSTQKNSLRLQAGTESRRGHTVIEHAAALSSASIYRNITA